MKLFSIKTRKFDYEKFIYFHGWIFLSPFSLFEDKSIGAYLRLKNGKNIKVKIQRSEGRVYTTLIVSTEEDRHIGERDREVLREQVSRMFCLDQDFTVFYEMCKDEPALSFVYKNNCRGMLRSPNTFEDVIKTICTTNCDWRNTKNMCLTLCSLDGGNFPTSKEILRYNDKKLSEMIPVGYRSRTILEVSRLWEDGKINVDKWVKEKDYEKIRRVLSNVWGIGDYCLNHILVLMGDYSFIPVDSEVLRYLKDLYFQGREISVKESVKPFEKYGEFRYLEYKYERMARKLNYINK
jgi:N-glycosylase/DNA lyase